MQYLQSIIYVRYYIINTSNQHIRLQHPSMKWSSLQFTADSSQRVCMHLRGSITYDYGDYDAHTHRYYLCDLIRWYIMFCLVIALRTVETGYGFFTRVV